MSYTPKEWQYRDIITADELNRMEEGIASAQGGGGTVPLIVNATTGEADEEYITTLDKTWQEIHDAFMSGRGAIKSQDGSYTAIAEVCSITTPKGTSYQVSVKPGDLNTSFRTDTASGYPTLRQCR